MIVKSFLLLYYIYFGISLVSCESLPLSFDASLKEMNNPQGRGEGKETLRKGNLSACKKRSSILTKDKHSFSQIMIQYNLNII